MTADEVAIRYMERQKLLAILRDVKSGTRIWRVAKDRQVSERVVKLVMRLNGMSHLIANRGITRKEAK